MGRGHNRSRGVESPVGFNVKPFLGPGGGLEADEFLQIRGFYFIHNNYHIK
jgi:hypothetical protein